MHDSLEVAHGERYREFNERGMDAISTTTGRDVCGVADEPPSPQVVGDTRLDMPVESPP